MTEEEAEVLSTAAWEHCFPPNKASDTAEEGGRRGKRRCGARSMNEKELSRALKF